MKKALSVLLACSVLLTGCSVHDNAASSETASSMIITDIVTAGTKTAPLDTEPVTAEENIYETEAATDAYPEPSEALTEVDTGSEDHIKSLGFTSLNDPDLMQYVEDTVYADLVNELNCDDYFVENVEAIYISKEYLDELAYNSQENIYFGYKLSELDEAFHGQKYIFTLGDDGQTTVKLFEEYDDTFDNVARNVAVGSGVILLCVTVSLVTGGAGTPAVIGSASAAAGDAGVSTVSMIFAASAKSAATFALSTGIISGVSAGISKGFESHDFNKALKASALEASEGFKWCAITGAITGGVGKYQELRFQKAMESFAKYSEMTSLNPESPIISTDIPEGYFYESTDLPTFIETPMDINTLNAEGLSPWQIAEKKAEAIFGGEAQVAFLNGERAAPNIKNVTKPDIVRKTANGYEAIEVKHYDLLNNLSQLINKLKGQIGDRVQNLPDNFEQRIVLDVTGRNYSKEFVMECIEKIQNSLVDIYPDIPINVVGI